MFRRIFLASSLLLLFSGLTFAQDGKLRGKVTDKETGDPLIGANVVIKGTTLGASTDLSGDYVVLAVPPGVYTVEVSYIGYQSVSLANIRVSANLTTTQDFELAPTALEIGAVEIVAERPLIQRNTTNTIRMTTQEDIQNIPIRGLQNIIALNAGTVLQDGVLHIRGGREREVAYFIDGATATNPFFNTENVSVIQEAIEEIQMQAGGYTAEFGGANSAVVRTTVRTGGPNFKATVDYRTDDFAHSGEQFLGTSSFGYRNAVITLGGPLTSKLRFFIAGQHNFMRNRNPSFIEPFRFDGLTDDGFEGREVGEPLPNGGVVEYKRNHLPKNWKQDNSVQGTLVYDVSSALKLRLTGSYRHYKAPTQGTNFFSSLFNYYNLDRRPELTSKTGLISLRATHLLNPTTYYEVNLSYSNRSAKTIDPVFGDNWRAYPDSIANAEKGYTGWQRRYLGPPRYSTINNFEFEAPGTPINSYDKQSQANIGAAIDFTSQVTKNWEVRAGGRIDAWTMRRYNIRAIRQLLEFEFGPDGNSPKTFANDYERWVKLGRTGSRARPIIYGYDIDGNKLDTFPNGPRKPLFASLYVQNKLEYRDLIVNFGLRFERIDVKAPRPKDLENPAFDETLDWIDESQMVETDPYDYLLPRVTFSFPVTDRTVFYALYGKYVQMPALYQIYTGVPELSQAVSPVSRSPYGYFGQWVGFTAKPERTTQYEMGIRQSLTDNFAFTITGFYKDLRDQLRWDRVLATGEGTLPEGASLFAGRINNDFGTVKGLELTLELRRVKRLAAKVNYTLSDTRGTGSDSRSSRVVVSDATIARYPTLIYKLDYNQPHRGSVILDYRFAKGDGGKILEGSGLNLLLSFNSGHSYTKIREPYNLGQATVWNVGVRALADVRGRNPEEPLNSSSTPWNFNVDLNLNKMFYFGKFNVDVYMNVLNVFDSKQVINVYPTTGTAEDDGWLRSPLAAPFYQIPNYVEFYRAINSNNRWSYMWATGNDLYGPPRQIRFGVRFEF
jgi:hypothetical protein